MTEPVIICPNCKAEIKLTESLAALPSTRDRRAASSSDEIASRVGGPLIESTRRQYEQRLADKDADVAKREAEIRAQQTALAKAQETLDEQVAVKLKSQRAAIAQPNLSRFELGWYALSVREVDMLLDALDMAVCFRTGEPAIPSRHRKGSR